MTLKKTLGRVLFLSLIVVILAAGLALWIEQPALHAIAWHLRHGNRLTFEAHTFHVPLLWSCTPGTGSNGWHLSHEHPLLGGSGDIELQSTGNVLDEAAAHRWQQEYVAAVGRIIQPPDTISAEILHGRRLEFVCVRDNTPGVAESLFCRAANTDLSVTLSASTKDRAQARTILTTSN